MMDDQDGEKRNPPGKSESKRREQFSNFFAELRKMLQSHGYPVKGDKPAAQKATGAATGAAQEKEEVKDPSEVPEDKSDCTVTFPDNENFMQTTLESLDGFLIVLSMDGVIIFVAENITDLLGYFPNELLGKKLLSFLPDHEKVDVDSKMNLRLPVVDPDKMHVEFCCHLKRGDFENGGCPTYEYVKFILNVKDVFHGPFVLFGGFNVDYPGAQSAVSRLSALPLEEQFFLVGTVCFLRADRLQELGVQKEAAKRDTSPRADEDSTLTESSYRSSQSEPGTSGRGSTSPEPAGSNSDTPPDSGETTQYEPDENTDNVKTQAGSPSATSSSPQAVSPELPTTSSSVHSGMKHQVEPKDQVEAPGTPPLTSVSTHPTDQSLLASPSGASGVDYGELELMQKFRQQLEKKTWALQASLASQQEMLTTIREQLHAGQEPRCQQETPDGTQDQLPAGQEPTCQAQPASSLQADSPQPQSSGPAPQKAPGKRTKTVLKMAKRFRGSSLPSSFSVPEELSCASPQVQQQQEPQLQDNPQPSPQWPSAVRTRALQFCLPAGANAPGPFYGSAVQLLQTQPVFIPVRLLSEMQAGQQPAVHCQNDSRGRDERRSGPAEERLGPASAEPKPRAPVQAPSPSAWLRSSVGFAQPSVRSGSAFRIPETTQNYMQLWQQPRDPQHRLFYQADSWPPRGQAPLYSQAIWHQVASAQMQAAEAVARACPCPEVFQAAARYRPDQLAYFPPTDQANLNLQQYFYWRQL